MHDHDPFALVKLLRPTCPGCGCSRLAWVHGCNAGRLLGQVRSDELLAEIPRAQRAAAEVWLCGDCWAAGVLGLLEWGAA